MNNYFVSANGTKVYTHTDAHPHRIDLAAEAIAKMVVPAAPADPTDRTQTRICETVDLCKVIGKNHLVETTEEDFVFLWDRGRGYESRMTMKETEDETRLTTVLFWDSDNDRWILWTNFEGKEGMPEPYCDRYNKGSKEFQWACDSFWETHALVPTEEEMEKILQEESWQIWTEEDESGYLTAVPHYYYSFDACVEGYKKLKDDYKRFEYILEILEATVA